ncbi:MAG TPA: R3H domain-containing nucleic acid-binding protein [Amnibacterium sp.]|nr:R3H domain-containing nucleic acid-binding protein [Amnibacterium sp.]
MSTIDEGAAPTEVDDAHVGADRPEQAEEPGNGAGSATDGAADAESGDAAPVDVGDLAADAAPIDVGDLAADYIEGLLDIADLDGDIDIEDEHGRTTLVVSGGDLRLLSAAETVGALQELTRLAVQTRTGDFARLTLDIGGSRDQRSRELATLVQRAVDAFATGDDRFELDAMSSYERKLVHDLAAAQGLGSHSEGEGPGRHIVLTPA